MRVPIITACLLWLLIGFIWNGVVNAKHPALKEWFEVSTVFTSIVLPLCVAYFATRRFRWLQATHGVTAATRASLVLCFTPVLVAVTYFSVLMGQFIELVRAGKLSD